MKDQRKCANAQPDKTESYLKQIFVVMKRKKSFFSDHTKSQFNRTEMHLLNEIISAKCDGKRLISTRLAEILGITRSAVSQIVNRLEEQGVLRRVPDEKDKKIAYIEITDEALEKYGKEMREELDFFADVVAEFGEDKFDTMCALLDEFMQKIEEKRSEQDKNETN